MLIPLKMIDVASTQEALIEFRIFIEKIEQGLKQLWKCFYPVGNQILVFITFLK